MSVHPQESAAERPTRQEEFNKSLIERAFQDVFASDAFDEGAIARYFSPRYVQKTDGRTLDFAGFVAHVRELKRTLKNVKITFERAVAEGPNVVSIHGAEAEKVAGGRVSVRVFALFVINEGKIILMRRTDPPRAGRRGGSRLGLACLKESRECGPDSKSAAHPTSKCIELLF